MPSNPPVNTDALAEVLRRYWGYDGFRPLQREAMECVLTGRDSVVVLPTGGGKSLCFQAPAICRDGLAVVVSPLISLMKDQVDALQACGVSAACVNSTHSYAQRRRVADEIRSGSIRLLYVAPERLVMDRTLAFLKEANVSFVAVDEAHCISQWGHDFRPEYRALKIIKETFPDVAVHAYTATATSRVRDDIASELGLDDPEILVGRFDRPNLIYRVDRRTNRLRQILAVLERHAGETGIIYCIRRADVEQTAAALAEKGHRALPYHAGMHDDARKRNQEAFIQERVDTIVATVAFGMGIDKPNVRYVIHAGMPKSLESYQQESGRAGRDGLEAECCLLYSGGDYGLWKQLIAEDGEEPAPIGGSLGKQGSTSSPLIANEIGSRRQKPASPAPGAQRTLSAMFDYATGVVCRHRVLSSYFGQELDAGPCNACDVCLGELVLVDDPLVIGQKILSCVVRLREQFGSAYTASVLSGSREQRILDKRHDQLSTWGILSEESDRDIRDWVEQLVGQGYLQKTGEYNVLQVTADGRRLLKGEATPRLLKPRPRPKKQKKEKSLAGVAAESWEGVDRGLFDALRDLRRQKADERKVPAYVVFGDAALRDMARLRPTSLAGFLEVRGVGEKKRDDFGQEFLACITRYCSEHELATDVGPAS